MLCADTVGFCRPRRARRRSCPARPRVTASAAAEELDAASRTVALLRAELPFLDSDKASQVIAADVHYELLGSLLTLGGRPAYRAAMQHWRTALPDRLGEGWTWQAQRVYQPEPRLLVVRWRMQWTSFSLGMKGLFESDRKLGSANSEDYASVSIASLVTSLKASETSLVAALEAHSDSEQLKSALALLQEGRAKAERLLAEVAEVEGVQLPKGIPQERSAALDADLAELKRSLTFTVSGATTLTLDAAGCVCRHVDTLDAFMASAPSVLRATVNEEQPGETEASYTQAVYQLCSSLRLPDSNFLTWQFYVVRALMWESFIRDADDEMRLTVTREVFDELVAQVLGATVFVSALTAGLAAYWLLNVAPQLPAAVADAAAASQAASVPAASTDWVGALSAALQPSLFR